MLVKGRWKRRDETTIIIIIHHGQAHAHLMQVMQVMQIETRSAHETMNIRLGYAAWAVAGAASCLFSRWGYERLLGLPC